MAATLDYLRFDEPPYGAGHPTELDRVNRGLKELVDERIQIIRSQTFGGQSGKTVTIPTPMNATTYMVAIKPKGGSGFIGEISVSLQALNSFVVYNSGSDIATQFDAIVTDLS